VVGFSSVFANEHIAEPSPCCSLQITTYSFDHTIQSIDGVLVHLPSHDVYVYITYFQFYHHPLVYSSAPHPQWSSGYDFRLSLTPTSRGRPGFDSLLRSKFHIVDSSSISTSLPVLAHQHRLIFFLRFWPTHMLWSCGRGNRR
jgi:hypothetical protein